ncbi:CBS domain-containing protein [Mycolicibacterium elephantis]|nr:CBS domain-containing protein [Mycolicibacterium elephantis]
MVLKPSDSVLEAARAIEHNRIGAVAVQKDGRLVGIATDRDLTVRVLGQGLDASSTAISEVMSSPPLTLSPRDDTADALRLMKERNVRRIPLVEDERIVGMVTLDDLILDEAAPLEEIAEVVEAQIGEGGPADSERAPGRRRSLVRAETTLNRLVNLIQEEADLDYRDQARTALDVVVAALVRRLNAGEAKDFVSQLPSLLKPHLRALPPGPDRSVTQKYIEAELIRRAGIEEDRATSVFVTVANTVLDSISPGEAEQVRSQLPKEMQKLFETYS